MKGEKQPRAQELVHLALAGRRHDRRARRRRETHRRSREADARRDHDRLPRYARVRDRRRTVRRRRRLGALGRDPSAERRCRHAEPRRRGRPQAARSRSSPARTCRRIRTRTRRRSSCTRCPNDRRIAEAGWDRASLGTIVRALGDGAWLGEYFDGQTRLPIILRADRRETPEELAEAPLVTPSGQVIPLGDVIKLETALGPSQIRRLDHRRTVTLTMDPPQTLSLEDALKTIAERDRAGAARRSCRPTRTSASPAAPIVSSRPSRRWRRISCSRCSCCSC